MEEDTEECIEEDVEERHRIGSVLEAHEGEMWRAQGRGCGGRTWRRI